MPELEKLNLTFRHDRKTKRSSLFREEIGEREYSEKTVAIGPLYIQQEAIDLIGNPKRIRVTIEPA